MMFVKRHAWQAAAIAVIACSVCAASWAQEKYPSRLMRIVTAQGPGAATDVLARFIAERLRRDFKTEIIVENKAGGGGIVGADFVAKSKPDGHTLGLLHASVVTTATIINPNVSYDAIRDFTPVAMLVTNPLALAVSAGSKWHTLEQLVEDAKKKPVSCGIIGVGSHSHFNLELLKLASGADFNRVPYSAGSGPIIAALLGGHLDCTSVAWVSVDQQMKAGKLRTLAVTSRIKDFPQIPTFASKGYPQTSLEVFFAIFGPAGLPQEVMARLVPALEAAMKDPDSQERLQKMGFSIMYEGPAQLAERVKHELTLVRDVAKKAGIQKEQ
jgi:tripartite-type tricarboxylate transporter receptor subunit TctC